MPEPFRKDPYLIKRRRALAKAIRALARQGTNTRKERIAAASQWLYCIASDFILSLDMADYVIEARAMAEARACIALVNRRKA